MRGEVVRLVPAEGFGFIRGEDGQEFFFHRSALLGTDFEELAPGTAVEFQGKRDAEGDEPGEHPRAVNVRLAADATPAEEHEVLPPEKTG